LSQIAEELDPIDTVAHSFLSQTLTFSNLGVIVQIPAPSKWQDMNSHGHSANFVPAPQDESPSKRRRLADDLNDEYLDIMKQLWRSLWQDKQDPSDNVTVHRGSDPINSVDVPATMKVLRLPRIFSGLGNVMIRSDYEEAIRDFNGDYISGRKSVIIVGHPGIGRTMGSVGQAGYSYMRPLI